MLPFALLAFFFIVLGGEREGARAAACDTGFFQRGVLDPAPPPSALLPPRSRKVERFGSSNAIEEETTRNWRQRSSGEKCERKKAKGAMSPALFFFSLSPHPGNAQPPQTPSQKQKQKPHAKTSPAALRSFPALGEDPLFCDTPAVLKGGAAAGGTAGNAAAGGAAPASKGTAGRPPRSRATGGAAVGAMTATTSAAAAAGLSPCPYSHDAFFRTVHALTGEFFVGFLGVFCFLN